MIKIITFTIIVITLLSCSSDDNTDDNAITCDFETIISADQFTNAPADLLEIDSLSIENDCLKINFSASGCDGSTWELLLIDANEILESEPVQRRLRLSLNNEEECLAIINQELSFDISNIQIGDSGEIILNITNNDASIVYEY